MLPLKPGTKVYITGPAADNGPVQCGGWTIDWNESGLSVIPGVTTIKRGLQKRAEQYGLDIVSTKNAAEADVILLVVGERTYAEWNGDSPDLQLCGKLGLNGNKKAIADAAKLGKPVVACIVAGRHVIIDDYDQQWDAIVMCYLPGSEGQGVADVLCGGTDFTGKLPSPWYRSLDQIGTDECWLPMGYGLSYN